jgi:Protein of unknown function (DUF3667)/zinc-ribbon domain
MPKLTTCPNCNTPLRSEDNFCPNCGQENRDLRVPIRQFFLDSLDSLFHITSFQGKLWQTVKAIFIRPGQLTIDYLAGRRARYVAPMRLYLYVSLLFFLLLGAFADEQLKRQKTSGSAKFITTDLHEDYSLDWLIRPDTLLEARGLEVVEDIEIHYPFSPEKAALVNQRLKKASEQALDSLLKTEKIPTTIENRQKLREALSLLPDKPDFRVSIGLISDDESKRAYVPFENDSVRQAFFRLAPTLTEVQIDSIITHAGAEPSFWNRKILRQGGRLMGLTTDQNIQKSLLQTILKNVSTMMFVLMPFVAVLLWMLYARRKQYRRFYYEHLIFSIHLHTVIFLLYGLVLAAIYFAKPESKQAERFFGFINVGAAVYFLIALKRVYRQSWLRTVGKFVLLIFIYGIVAVLFLAGAALTGLLTV